MDIYTNNWRRENSSEKLVKLCLFLLSPLLALLYSFRNFHTKSSYKVLFWFTLFFGFCMVFNQDARNDGKFHAYEFQQYEKKDFTQYSNEVGSFFTIENKQETKDIFNITVQYIVSRCTDNYHLYFMIIALVYGLLISRGLRFFTSDSKFDNSVTAFVLLYIYFVFQFYGINAVRFGTAAWLAIICLFKIFRDKDNRYIALAFLTPLIHASFVFFLGMIAVAFFTRRYEKLWFVLFVLSFVFSEISMELFAKNVAYLPGFMSDWADAYAHFDEWYEVEGSGFFWLSNLLKVGRRFFLAFMLFLIYRDSKVIKSNPKTADLFQVVFVIFSIANFLSAIPSFSRFVSLSQPLIAYIWLVNFKDVKYNKLLLFYPIVSIVSIKENIDLYRSLFEPCFLYSSPLYLIWKYVINYVPVTLDMLFQ